MHQRRSRPAQQCQHGSDRRRQPVVEPVLAVDEADRRAGDGEHDEGQHEVALGHATPAVPPQPQRHRLAEHQAQAVHQQVAERHVGRAIQRERQRHRAAQIGRAEQRDQPGIEQQRGRGGERLGAERVQAPQQRQPLEHDEHAGIARLERAAEASQHAGDQRRAQLRSLAVQRAGEQGEIGQDGGDQQVLALAEIAGRAPPAARCRSRRTPAGGRRTTCRCPAAGRRSTRRSPARRRRRTGWPCTGRRSPARSRAGSGSPKSTRSVAG